jgi:integrase
MASIHKRKKSPYWFCAYVLPDGKRAFRSTKQTERKKAWEICRTLDKASLMARQGELTEIQMRKLLDGVLESTGAAPSRTDTVRSFVTSWLDGKALSVTPGTHRHYQTVLEAFLLSLGPLADRSLSAIAPAQIAAYQNSRMTQVASGTLTLEMKAIRSLFGTAQRLGLILHNPAVAIRLPRVRSIERETFTSAELGALLAHADPQWRTLILCGYHLGGRLADMAALRWQNVDLAAGWITYTQGKTGRRVGLPIHEKLLEHFLELAGDKDGFLCPTLARARIDGNSGLTNQFRRLMQSAGVDASQVQAARNKFSRKTFHSLRHSFVSALANAGVSPELRMKLSGHRSASVHQLYTHHEMAPLQNAIALLPRISR